MQKYVIALYIRLSIEDYKYDTGAQPSGGGAELRRQCACVQRDPSACERCGHPAEPKVSCRAGRPEERNERRSAAFDHQAGGHGGAGTGQP